MTIDRRSALRFGIAAAAALCPLCRIGDARAASGITWSYEGPNGTDEWGKLSPDFQACSASREQTPIDLKDGIRAEPGELAFAYQAAPVRILNNGHTIQVNCDAGSKALIVRESYDLLQYHFHHPSEHILEGKRFALELHLVHRNAAGQLAVVGVFIQAGEENPALQALWSVMPTTAGAEQATNVSVNPGRLLPANRTYFRYFGSLTTPPCSDGVLWTMFKEPISASEEQILQFAKLFPMNARPVQPLHRRFLLQSGS
jgi:carbonic anhydrase